MQSHFPHTFPSIRCMIPSKPCAQVMGLPLRRSTLVVCQLGCICSQSMYKCHPCCQPGQARLDTLAHSLQGHKMYTSTILMPQSNSHLFFKSIALLPLHLLLLPITNRIQKVHITGHDLPILLCIHVPKSQCQE